MTTTTIPGRTEKDCPANLSAAAFGEAAECLRTLAHPVRLRLVQLLLGGRYTVGELARRCDVPSHIASEHLRLMQRCGFFSSVRDGRKVFYEVAEPHLQDIMRCLERRFSTGGSV